MSHIFTRAPFVRLTRSDRLFVHLNSRPIPAPPKVASQLHSEAAALSLKLTKELHQAISGKPLACPPLRLSLHRHTIDLQCGPRGFVKVFVFGPPHAISPICRTPLFPISHIFILSSKLSHAAYHKLAMLHRRHSPKEAPPAEVEGGEQGAAPGAEQGTEQAIRAEVFAAQEEAGVGEVGDDDDEEGAEEGGSDDDGGSDDEEGERDDAKGESKGDSKGAAQKKSRLVDNASGGTRGAFHLRLFALLLRYKSLRGHGFQAAVGPDVWKVLTSKLEVGFECFASPLNAYLPAYSSAFTDVDAPFGSSGSFFGLSALKGSFAANPPFVHSIMDAAAEHALSLLDAATKAQGDHALSFVFFLPGWTESKAFFHYALPPYTLPSPNPHLPALEDAHPGAHLKPTPQTNASNPQAPECGVDRGLYPCRVIRPVHLLCACEKRDFTYGWRCRAEAYRCRRLQSHLRPVQTKP